MTNTIKTPFKVTLNQRWILPLMLLSLHLSLLTGFNGYFEKALLVTHYGLFLLWQPLWRGTEKLSLSASILFLICGFLALYLINWWLMAFWIACLFSLLGGRVVSKENHDSKITYLLAATYLLATLLIWIVPNLLGVVQDLEIAELLMQYVMPTLPLAVFFKAEKSDVRQHAPVIDFFYTLILLLLTIILILGSFSIGSAGVSNYAEILLKAIFSLAIILFVISWLWNPHAGFSGIEVLMSRYLLSVGMPFEQWVKNIARIGDMTSNPHEFTQAAMREMLLLNWVSGLKWEAEESQGELGESSKYVVDMSYHSFNLTLFTRWQLSPAFYIHAKLLTQILGEFYEAKLREEMLRQQSYMQAFYETGSRLTHDIKNILQSTGTLCAAVDQADSADNERIVGLVRRQLPLLNQRISATLDKLKAPSEEKKRQERVSHWWKNMQQRYALNDIDFVAHYIPAIEINAEVLDSVVDNLIQNALEKARHEPGVSITTELLTNDGFCVLVTDTGSAMPEATANKLFKQHVSSKNGLGVGLFHAGKQAEQAGYALRLIKNISGRVQFSVRQIAVKDHSDSEIPSAS